MLGVYDFCGHYEWTFEWLRQQGGEPLVREFWDAAIHQDSQWHAVQLILGKGFAGMQEYWSHTLAHEGAGYHTTATDQVFRIDMHACPSKGFLIRNGLEQYRDYCDHCMGWIGPLLRRGGFVVDHQHNHCGQCWWEIRHATDATTPSRPGELSGERDVRLRPEWELGAKPMDTYSRATDPDDKQV
ncbi:MAG: hypothetical protein AB1705_07940 [Verrucomicrobiota bacterium]